MPVSGWLMSSAAGVSVVWFGVLPLPDLVPRDPDLFETLRTLHNVLSRCLIVVVALHVAAVMHHDLLRRDGIFRRMWPSEEKLMRRLADPRRLAARLAGAGPPALAGPNDPWTIDPRASSLAFGAEPDRQAS